MDLQIHNPDAEGRPAADLAELASRINTEHAAVEASARTSLEHARATGELLASVR